MFPLKPTPFFIQAISNNFFKQQTKRMDKSSLFTAVNTQLKIHSRIQNDCGLLLKGKEIPYDIELPNTNSILVVLFTP